MVWILFRLRSKCTVPVPGRNCGQITSMHVLRRFYVAFRYAWAKLEKFISIRVSRALNTYVTHACFIPRLKHRLFIKEYIIWHIFRCFSWLHVKFTLYDNLLGVERTVWSFKPRSGPFLYFFVLLCLQFLKEHTSPTYPATPHSLEPSQVLNILSFSTMFPFTCSLSLSSHLSLTGSSSSPSLSPLLLCITPSLIHPRLKTYIFDKSFPPHFRTFLTDFYDYLRT